MKQVSLHNAAMHLSALVNDVTQSGKSIMITKEGRELAMLIPPKKALSTNLDELNKEMDSLREEIGRSGFNLAEIQALKEEARH